MIIQMKFNHEYSFSHHITQLPIGPLFVHYARNDRKSLLIRIRTAATYCFSEKVFIYRCVLSKIVESISPYRMYSSKQKQNTQCIPDNIMILCNPLKICKVD
jgi:hypothetical protein